MCIMWVLLEDPGYFPGGIQGAPTPYNGVIGADQRNIASTKCLAPSYVARKKRAWRNREKATLVGTEERFPK